MAQISPFGSFVPLVNLAGVGTPDPPLTGANLPLFGEHNPPDKGSSLSILRQRSGHEAVLHDIPYANAYVR